MKTNRIQYTVIVLISLLLVKIELVQGQDLKSNQDLDFQIDLIPVDSKAFDGTSLTDLELKIECNRIDNPKKVYVKVISIAPREVYLIRSIEYYDLQRGVDVESWELEREAIEKERKKERKAKSDQPGKRRYMELWESKRYEKQEGRKLKKVNAQDGDITLAVGSFSPGEYEVYAGVKDGSSVMYLDAQKITIPSN